MYPVEDRGLDRHNPLYELGVLVNQLLGRVALGHRHLLSDWNAFNGRGDPRWLPHLLHYKLGRAYDDYEEAVREIRRRCILHFSRYAQPLEEVERLFRALAFARYRRLWARVQTPAGVGRLDRYTHQVAASAMPLWEKLALYLQGLEDGYWQGTHNAYNGGVGAHRLVVPASYQPAAAAVGSCPVVAAGRGRRLWLRGDPLDGEGLVLPAAAWARLEVSGPDTPVAAPTQFKADAGGGPALWFESRGWTWTR